MCLSTAYLVACKYSAHVWLIVQKLFHVLTLHYFSFLEHYNWYKVWVFYMINIANNNEQHPSIRSIFVSLVTRGAVVLDSKNHSWTLPIMLGVVASLLVVVGKQMQQLPTMLGPKCIMERIQPLRLCKSCVMHVNGPNNVGSAVQTDPTLLRYALAIMEQKKCWELLAQMFDRFQTLRNNSQQHTTTCNRVCKRIQYATSNNIGNC